MEALSVAQYKTIPKRSSEPTNLSPKTTDDEVAQIISEEFPHWKFACSPAAPNPVVLTERDFGRSLQGIFLMPIANRYAGIMGKTVVIAPCSER